MSNATYLETVISTQPYGYEYIGVESAPFHFHFEEVDYSYWSEMFTSNPRLFLYVGALYILVIFGLQRWMKDRPAFNLRGPLFMWNLSLGIFSIVGFIRTLPGFLYVLGRDGGFYTSICEKKGGDVPFGFWIHMFIFSKFVELGDTVFIVLRKRPLIFIQWYHHLVTMSVTWIVVPMAEPVCRWYTILNFGVHSLMYPYFAVKTTGAKVPTSVAKVITTLQLAQMVIGLGVNMLSMYYYQQSGYDCARYPVSIQIFGMIYGSFLLLFGKLFYDSVINKKKGQLEKKLE